MLWKTYLGGSFCAKSDSISGETEFHRFKILLNLCELQPHTDIAIKEK